MYQQPSTTLQNSCPKRADGQAMLSNIARGAVYHGILFSSSSRYQVFELLLCKLNEDAFQQLSSNQISLNKLSYWQRLGLNNTICCVCKRFFFSIYISSRCIMNCWYCMVTNNEIAFTVWGTEIQHIFIYMASQLSSVAYSIWRNRTLQCFWYLMKE